jgi:hypothetical protein
MRSTPVSVDDIVMWRVQGEAGGRKEERQNKQPDFRLLRRSLNGRRYSGRKA